MARRCGILAATEGLTLGPVLDGVELGGKLYFGSAWDDHRGSLTVHDPETGVFTPWFRADGMDSDKVVGLAVNDGKLLVRYGVDHPGDDTDNRLAPGRFDPATGKFTSGGTERIAPVEGKRPAPAINGILPVLGGPAYRSYDRAGMTWHCGGRGLVIHPGTKAPSLNIHADAGAACSELARDFTRGGKENRNPGSGPGRPAQGTGETFQSECALPRGEGRASAADERPSR